MKVSERKMQANRKNAEKSTGPKSLQGKANSKGNAFKHGAFATSTLFDGEDKILYATIKAELKTKFHPQTFVEKALIDQLLSELWNLRRLARAEFLLGQQTQKHLQEIMKSDLTVDDRAFIQKTVDSPEKLSLRMAKGELGLDSGDKLERQQETKQLLNVYKKLVDEQFSLDPVYLEIFLYSSHERMQRLLSLKRHNVQNILGIERELERRLLLRSAVAKK